MGHRTKCATVNISGKDSGRGHKMIHIYNLMSIRNIAVRSKLQNIDCSSSGPPRLNLEGLRATGGIPGGGGGFC